MEWNEAKELPVGHIWTQTDLMQHFEAVCGGVAFPGKRPGFAVVAGLKTGIIEKEDEAAAKDSAAHDPRSPRWGHLSASVSSTTIECVYLLAEFESWDLGALLRQCKALGTQYSRRVNEFTWYGDTENKAANALKDDCMDMSPTHVLEMDGPFSYIMPFVKDQLKPGNKSLFLRDSKLVEYLTSGIKEDELPSFDFGEYPAIEALAHAVLGIRECREIEQLSIDYSDDRPGWRNGTKIVDPFDWA